MDDEDFDLIDFGDEEDENGLDAELSTDEEEDFDLYDENLEETSKIEPNKVVAHTVANNDQ